MENNKKDYTPLFGCHFLISVLYAPVAQLDRALGYGTNSTKQISLINNILRWIGWCPNHSYWSKAGFLF